MSQATVFPSFMPVSENLMDLQFVMRLELTIKQWNLQQNVFHRRC